jgi:hypothetical protein
VQVPAQPVDDASAFGHQVIPVVDQQPHLPHRPLRLGGGKLRFPQGGPGDREGVNGV